MGYTRVIHSGQYTEVYFYEKPYVSPKTTFKRRRRSSTSQTDRIPLRSSQSIRRARSLFTRTVQANLATEEKPTFVTLTHYKGYSLDVGYKHLRYFYEELRTNFGEIRAISVPEWQPQSGYLHFHVLVWGIPETYQGTDSERSRRILQRLWGRGYLDVCPTYDKSPAIAGYLAKYMQEALHDERLGNRRAYSSTHNILRPMSAGGNSLSNFLSGVGGLDQELDQQKEYDTLYLGRCIYKRYRTLPIHYVRKSKNPRLPAKIIRKQNNREQN